MTTLSLTERRERIERENVPDWFVNAVKSEAATAEEGQQ